MSFQEFCDKWEVTQEERIKLVHMLALMRYREALKL